MIKVAVLDDYQNVFKEFIDIEKYQNKYSFKIFTNPFQSEDEAILELENFDVIFAMRERTKISKSVISVSMTSGKEVGVPLTLTYRSTCSKLPPLVFTPTGSPTGIVGSVTITF